MLVGKGYRTLGLEAKVIELDTNSEASDYIMSNYNELIKFIRSNNIKEEKANDLLHDVYISIVDDENNGEAFDMEYGTNHDKTGKEHRLMEIKQFVHGRIKLYAKNKKYRTDIVESGNGYNNVVSKYNDTVLGVDGAEEKDQDGNVKTVRRYEKHKVPVVVSVMAATSTNTNDLDANDTFQKAYYSAEASYLNDVKDVFSDVDAKMSMQEEISYCIDICELHGINVLNIFRNIDTLSAMIGDSTNKKRVADTVFKKITELGEYHDEFRESFIDVVRFSRQNKEAFDGMLKAFA